MLKVRLMGTKNDIKWFGKILQRNSKIEVTEFSDLFPNKSPADRRRRTGQFDSEFRIYRTGYFGSHACNHYGGFNQ